MFYAALEGLAVEPPLMGLCVREPETGYRLFSYGFSQAVACFHGLSPGSSTIHGLKLRFLVNRRTYTCVKSHFFRVSGNKWRDCFR